MGISGLDFWMRDQLGLRFELSTVKVRKVTHI